MPFQGQVHRDLISTSNYEWPIQKEMTCFHQNKHMGSVAWLSAVDINDKIISIRQLRDQII